MRPLKRASLLLLDQEQLRAIFLHELGHVRNRDFGLLTWARAFRKGVRYWLLFAILAFVVQDLLYGYDVWVIVLDIIASTVPIAIFAVIIPILSLNSISRRRESLADTFAISKVSDGNQLISAIETLALSKISFGILSGKARPGILQRSPKLRKLMHFIRKYTVAVHPGIADRETNIRRSMNRTPRPDQFLPSLETSIIAGLLAAIILELLSSGGSSFYLPFLFRANFNAAALEQSPFIFAYSVIISLLTVMLPLIVITLSNTAGILSSYFRSWVNDTGYFDREIPGPFVGKLALKNLISVLAFTIPFQLIGGPPSNPTQALNFSFFPLVYFLSATLVVIWSLLYVRLKVRFKIRRSKRASQQTFQSHQALT